MESPETVVDTVEKLELKDRRSLTREKARDRYCVVAQRKQQV